MRSSSQKNCRCINYNSSCDPKTFTFTTVLPILFTLKFMAAVRIQWRVSYSKSTSLMPQLSNTESSSAASVSGLIEIVPEAWVYSNPKQDQILKSPHILDQKRNFCADFQIIFYSISDFCWNAWNSPAPNWKWKAVTSSPHIKEFASTYR